MNRTVLFIFFSILIIFLVLNCSQSEIEEEKPVIGSGYNVYGGDIYINGSQGYYLDLYGYNFIGKSEITETYVGSYKYYVIKTNDYNIAEVDTVEGSNNQYYQTWTDSNTLNSENVGGIPDSLTAKVGGLYDGEHGGYILIDASGDNLTWIKVYID